MKNLELSGWFRRRMLPLVVGSSLAGAVASPAVYYVLKRRELVASARAEAERAASTLTDVVLQRPRLWRYDTSKIAERLAGDGIAQRGPFVVHDARGVRVPLGDPPPTSGVLWGQAQVLIAGRREATVWIGTPTRPLHAGTAVVGGLAALLSLLLGSLLYVIPTRAIAAAERRIRSLLGQLSLTLQEEERGRIARDLHDSAGQALTAARLHLLSLRKGLPPQAVERANAIADHIDEALEEIRRSTAALRPPALAELGLRGAIERQAEATASAAGVAVTCDIDLPQGVEAHVETALYRITQECLTNAARHSGARSVRVDLRREGNGLRLRVEDDGRGLGAEPSQGNGLRSIQERARLLGGESRFSPASPGLRVEVTVPLDTP